MSAALTLTHEYDQQTCITCGCVWWMPMLMLSQRRKDKQNFYCPSGHSQAFIESESDRLRKQVAALEAQKAAAEARERMATNRADGIEKKLRRTEKRLKGGACPCCNRTFTNLGRHMHTKHPDFAAPKTTR